MRETDLYPPIQRLLEEQGYEVKSEIGPADVVAVRSEEPPVIVELKTGFSLSLIHQAIARMKLTDKVYVAVPEWKGRSGWKAFRQNLLLCRRLGLGVITVKPDLEGADIHADPLPYVPRKSRPRRERLLREFQRRVGDPNQGGADRRSSLVTAYRQSALKCLAVLHENGPTKAAQVAALAEVARARDILAADHYGWFERVERGIYAITPNGVRAVSDYAEELAVLARHMSSMDGAVVPDRREDPVICSPLPGDAS